jgi:nitrogen fixation-related uncharacterized protein
MRHEISGQTELAFASGSLNIFSVAPSGSRLPPGGCASLVQSEMTVRSVEGFVKGFLIFLFVVAIAVVGLGFYRGWWSVSSTKDADNKVHIDLTVNKDKLSEDEKAALKKVQSVEPTARDKAPGTEKAAPATDKRAVGATEKEAKEAGIAPSVYQQPKK